ncbi:MAG: hypothetical protein JXA71_17835 [Chitinispirillaceae bacterium]|nr:hypothetical protein [Chitinispirillaceae bacterium]
MARTGRPYNLMYKQIVWHGPPDRVFRTSVCLFRVSPSGHPATTITTKTLQTPPDTLPRAWFLRKREMLQKPPVLSL